MFSKGCIKETKTRVCVPTPGNLDRYHPWDLLYLPFMEWLIYIIGKWSGRYTMDFMGLIKKYSNYQYYLFNRSKPADYFYPYQGNWSNLDQHSIQEQPGWPFALLKDCCTWDPKVKLVRTNQFRNFKESNHHWEQNDSGQIIATSHEFSPQIVV